MKTMTCAACCRGTLRTDSNGAYCPECGRFSDVQLIARDYEGNEIGRWQVEVERTPVGGARADLDDVAVELGDWHLDRLPSPEQTLTERFTAAARRMMGGQT